MDDRLQAERRRAGLPPAINHKKLLALKNKMKECKVFLMLTLIFYQTALAT
jgi:hypothetical protein